MKALRFGPTASFAVVAYAFFVAMSGTTLPTPLYPIYQQHYGFSPLTITLLFAIYALTVVASLLLFGRFSDDNGRKPVLITSVAMGVASALCFLFAHSLPPMFVGRVLSGISAGLMTGTGTATLLDLGGENRLRSATVALAVNMGGLGGGSFIAGALAEWGSHALRVPFIVNLVFGSLALVGLVFVSTDDARTGWKWVVQKPTIPTEVKGVFGRAALSAGTAFGVGGVLTAVSGIFLAKDLGLPNHALAGGLVAVYLATTALGQIAIRRMSDDIALPFGCALMVVSACCVAGALLSTTLAPLIAGAFLCGIGGGMCTGAGLRAIGSRVRPQQRGATSSTFFMVVYVWLATPAIAVGLFQHITSLKTAGVSFSAIVAIITLVVGVDVRVKARRVLTV